MEEDPRVVRAPYIHSRDLPLMLLLCCYRTSSGDTGVSAALVLHGTPPFQVYYRQQRDSEPARETSKTFASSRGELTLQPERSGHYTFKFTQLSDANYKKTDLKGPSIELDVHPPPAADFVRAPQSGRGKKSISSCAGNMVDVDVELRVSLLWHKGCIRPLAEYGLTGYRPVERRSSNRWAEGL